MSVPVQYPIPTTIVNPGVLLPTGNIPGGGVWRYDALDAGTFVTQTGRPPIVQQDRADPASVATLDAYYLPFIVGMTQVDGTVGDTFKIDVRGRIGPATAFTWTTTLSPNYNPLNAPGAFPTFYVSDIINVTPGWPLARNATVSLEMRIASNFFGTVNPRLWLGYIPGPLGWKSASPFLSVLDVSSAQGYAQLSSP